MIIFETNRLQVRTATVDDVDMFYTLWTDPRVMTPVGFPQGLRTTKEKIKEDIQNEQPSEFKRYLVVQLKDTNQVIGECKMITPNEEGISETDVKLLPEFWGHRYGVEIKQALVDYLFSHTDCIAVQATPNKKNIASIKMQETVGGVLCGEGVFEFPEKMQDYTAPVPHYVYRVFRESWEQAKQHEVSL